MNVNPSSPSTSGLTAQDRMLLAEIAKSATRPGWKHKLTMAWTLLCFLMWGGMIFSIPFLMKARGLRICERHGSQWFPLAPTPDRDFLEPLLRSTGVGLFIMGVFAATWIWVRVRRDRRLHELLSKSYPP